VNSRIASNIVIRFHGGEKSMSWPPTRTAGPVHRDRHGTDQLLHHTHHPVVVAIAAYTSSIVNSGLWERSIPSFRKSFEIS